MQIQNRHLFSFTVFILYLIPLFFLIIYTNSLITLDNQWFILSLGLLTIAVGSFIITLFTYYWEKAIPKKIPIDYKPTVVEKTNVVELDFQSALKEIETEKKDLQVKLERMTYEFLEYKRLSEEQLKQKIIELNSLQKIMEDQQNEMDKRKDQIQQLDTKIHDLSYEIKTLLCLNENEKSTQKTTIQEIAKPERNLKIESIHDDISIENEIKNPNQASLLLKHCIQIAQKITGSNYYGNESSKFWELSSPHFAIDQRRLFDSLKEENAGIILVYSPRENKPIFVNNQVKHVLGWGPEKFLQDFHTIMQDGQAYWQKALEVLMSSSQESQTRLLMKSKPGQEIVIHCHLGLIPSGVFKNYMIGVLYSLPSHTL